MNALDALLCFGYRIIKADFLEKASYKLCGKNADKKYKESTNLLLEEINEKAEYYAKEIIERGKKL